MRGDSLKLTVYFGESDRFGRASLADSLLDAFGRRGLATSVLMRGAQGFGAKQHLRSARLLTLSEDLPLVAVAVDERGRIEAAVPEVDAMVGDGLVTLERAGTAPGSEDDAKLTVYCGRKESAGGRPAFVAVVELLHRHGLGGATVLLGVDGTIRGERRRARFLARNADVPLMIISVGAANRAAAALEELRSLLEDPVLTLERVRVCRRDGRALNEPDGRPPWQKLMVYSSGAKHLHVELVRRLRAAGAGGATCLRGIWGYHGDHAPHGDKLLAVRRHVPVVTVIVDEPERVRRWFDIVSEVTAESGLVTSERVPAARTYEKGKSGLRIE